MSEYRASLDEPPPAEPRTFCFVQWLIVFIVVKIVIQKDGKMGVGYVC